MSCNDNRKDCPDRNGCPKGECPDFVIRRYDTKPDYRVLMEDCDGPMDLTDLILEASMWANSKLKNSISETETAISLADNIGFDQINVGDILLVERARNPEKMVVLSFDEDNKIVNVDRAQDGSTAQAWKKGSSLKIIKFLDSPAKIEMVYEDVLDLDGTVKEDVLQESYFVYEWSEQDTSFAGCYYLEFKLIKEEGWVRRFPVDKEGFIIKIVDTFTSE